MNLEWARQISPRGCYLEIMQCLARMVEGDHPWVCPSRFENVAHRSHPGWPVHRGRHRDEKLYPIIVHPAVPFDGEVSTVAQELEKPIRKVCD